MFCLVGGCGCDSDFWGGYECIAGQVGECCKSRRLTAFGKASGTSLVCVVLPFRTARGSSAMKYILFFFFLHLLNPSFV